ncbi:unnamed protein product [Arabidopsis lyrata]|uniref:uncharacterized protein LOC110224604 n=1 Tax=Arabidopsis lyrata subsp. lyrata TaxID=81972 RepID=UPI000A29ADA4|nr:uncharacterized protein LOC110224604 [Arabidopsis lyrata subsp. lyrata]CAH8251235.1 unnamed protein product [Arabidopsis lyrata]|eukprot:XP_020866577.1 uncharacterized protein LOC110224604 [Arabidopsis lyrata subsp. lyrata]
MFFSLIRQCYRSSPADRKESSSSSTAIDTHARTTTTTISRSVNRHAPRCPEQRRIDGTRRWRPSLSAISEDAASTTVFAGEADRSFGKVVARETTSFSRRDTTLKRAWRNTITYRIASPGYAPSPFMY